jgi:hypothetical protein
VVEQDITTDEAGRVVIAWKTAPDRVISVSDPDRHPGRKTSSQKYDGYKRHRLAQTAPSGQPRRTTAAVATAANVADGAVLPELLKERAELTGERPKKVMGDTAYGSMAKQDEVSEVAPQTPDDGRGAGIARRNGGGRYAKTDVGLDVAAHPGRCPAGTVITYTPKKRVVGHK